ncbi:unnamed protein product [Mycetohabitans rhizoxinica HKI 454]|uniref:Uncharacterized protein n=1 Tax=Mycetohabitans rhizoxinica (strain DSM 19002 / CIP 109453 / HKI 454) TaxID=882378 RepID=E5AM79_MYCRK|nr:unnamed protein product [Mycetohabitans rhizoxinica HKI 454]
MAIDQRRPLTGHGDRPATATHRSRQFIAMAIDGGGH